MGKDKPIVIGVPKETASGETRVALTPASLPELTKAGAEILIESGAGLPAGFEDGDFTKKGATTAGRDQVFAAADVILQVRTYGANPGAGQDDLSRLKPSQMLVGLGEPLTEAERAQTLAKAGVTFFALELLPRTTRAQNMDVLSSMATIAGYKAVLLAAAELPRMFPMLMTAAGTLAPARAFVVGAGVAGLQAIATAKRLGAVVQAYDIRSTVKEQIESVGGTFVHMDLEAQEAEEKGGYAKEMGEEFLEKQRQLMKTVVAKNDVVITTAAVPGKKAPVLVTEDMVEGMAAGSVLVDLAAERGGNCDLTQPGKTVEAHGVKIIGPLNLPATVAYHASQMYGRNVTNFLLNLIKDGEININLEDEIVADTLVTRTGEVVNPRVRELLGPTGSG